MDDFPNSDDENFIDFDFINDGDDDDVEYLSAGAAMLEQSLLQAIYADNKDDFGPYDALSVMLDVLQERYGQQGAYLMMHAIENKTGWSMEIIGSRDEVEQTLWEKYSIFDEDAWHKAKNSPYWDAMVRDIYSTSMKWFPIIIKDVADIKTERFTRVKKLVRSLTVWLYRP